MTSGVYGLHSKRLMVTLRDEAFTTGVWTAYNEFQDVTHDSVAISRGCRVSSALSCFTEPVEFVAAVQTQMLNAKGVTSTMSALIVTSNGTLYCHPLCDKDEAVCVSYMNNKIGSVADEQIQAFLQIKQEAFKTRLAKMRKSEQIPLPVGTLCPKRKRTTKNTQRTTNKICLQKHLLEQKQQQEKVLPPEP